MTDTTAAVPAVASDAAPPAYAGIGFGGASGFDIAPQSLGEVVAFAKLMASAKHAIPGHLRDNAGACMAVTIQALGWQMSPFQVAQKSYKVGDTIAYEAQLIAAVVNARAGFKNRPLVEYIGEGQDRQCRVTFTFKNGDVRDYLSPKVKDIAVKNSPLWKSDQDQQLSYFSLRSAARRHCPEVILGVYDPDELEQAEPMAERVSAREPISMRAKLADQTGNKGFDPNHVEAETGGEVVKAEVVGAGGSGGPGSVTMEIVQAEGKPEANEPPEARTESEARNNLADALKSLDAKPEPTAGEKMTAQMENPPEGFVHVKQGDPTPAVPTDASAGQESGQSGSEPSETSAPVNSEETPSQDGSAPTASPSETDGADDLIRQNAYDDGYAGEPVDAVLVMCEDEREEAIARSAHAEGHAARIAKEAADHAASETQAQADADQAAHDALDIGGAAPAGTKYLLGTEEPAADGKINLYQDGEVFSRVPAEPALAKHPRYDSHPKAPEPTDPALASQSGGTGLPDQEAPKTEPAAEDQTKGSPEAEMKPNGLYLELAAKDSWLQIKPLLTILYGSEPFKALSPEDQAATRAHLFGAVLEMKERTKDPVDWGQDVACFSLWLDWKASGDDSASDKVDAITGTFQTIQGGKAWKQVLKDEQRTVLETRVAGVLAKLKAA